MSAISDGEHQKFNRLHELGHKMLSRGKELAEKDNLTEEEVEELAEIQRILKKVDDWFDKTAK
jgi:Zn-dependent peptidase ImmA (M78 family)